MNTFTTYMQNNQAVISENRIISWHFHKPISFHVPT